MLSVIIPSYNEEKAIRKTAETITAILHDNKIEYEIIFVNDGSSEHVMQILKAFVFQEILERNLPYLQDLLNVLAMPAL